MKLADYYKQKPLNPIDAIIENVAKHKMPRPTVPDDNEGSYPKIDVSSTMNKVMEELVEERKKSSD